VPSTGAHCPKGTENTTCEGKIHIKKEKYMNTMYGANQMILGVLRQMKRDQVVSYLEAKGWQVEEYPDETIQLYRLKGGNRPVLITLPLDFCQNLSTLQECLERMAFAEQTSFIGIVCKILGVEQFILKPPG
jgi:hypothetical protein